MDNDAVDSYFYEQQNSRSSSTSNQGDELFDAPLANILPSEFEGVDPRIYFPDFKKDAILRFTRLFSSQARPTMGNQIWWASKTFRKDVGMDAADKPSTSNSNHVKEEEIPEKASDHEEKLELSKWLTVGPPPKPDDCKKDNYEILCSNEIMEAKPKSKLEANECDEDSAPPWRFGPAQMWYDQMGLQPNPSNFKYGLKTKEAKPAKTVVNGQEDVPDINDPLFSHFNLLNWKDNIVFDDEIARKSLIEDYSSGRLPRCGWIPTQHTRTYQSFMNAWNSGAFLKMFTNPAQRVSSTNESSETKYTVDEHHSLFPFDNYELEHTRWEDNIIWDPDNMPAIPKPSVLTLDYEDDPKIFGIPEELADDKLFEELGKNLDVKDSQYTRRSKMILNQVAKRQRQEEEEQLETTIAQIADKDPFNLSNDDYYLPKANQKQMHSMVGITSLIQHSFPAQNIHPVLFPHHLSPFKLRHFHRMPMSRRLLCRFNVKFTPILSLARHVRMTNEQRETLTVGDGGGFEIFTMRDLKDLTGRDGLLLLVEYSEEHPPFLNQPGMASRIRNYKSKESKDRATEFEFGERAFTQNFPFLGSLAPNQYMQAIENKMFRSPIYGHKFSDNDFLLVRNKLGFFIRPFSALFLAGQECPIEVVPGPNSKQANNFINNFLLAYIYRSFWNCDDSPRKIRMEDIRLAFPSSAYPEAVLKKRLKHCADIKKFGSGIEQTYLVLRDDFHLPSREEIMNMITPETYCAYVSMLAAEQRFKDAGYGEKYFFTPENEESEEQILEDEIKSAPWNTTKAFIDAQSGKCFLDQTGIADPTAVGQGFSYVRVSARPPKTKEDVTLPKRLVTGTNADLRKLPLKDAKEICRQYGLIDDEINSLTRWEIIDVIRNLSTEAAKTRSTEFAGMVRFARGNVRATIADMQEKYKSYCQKIFDLQNQVLSGEVASSQLLEDASEIVAAPEKHPIEVEENSGPNRGVKSLFSSLSTLSDARKRQIEFEREERERLDLQKMIHGEVTKTGSTISTGAKEAAAANLGALPLADNPQQFEFPDPKANPVLETPRQLKIYRTVQDRDGNEVVQMEVVTHSQLIDAYIRIRSTRDDDFIKIYAQQDEDYKEEKRKEKRRLLQEQMRKKRLEEKQKKIEQQQQKIATPSPPKAKKPEKIKKPPPPPKPNLLKLHCSACGAIGHMKTNRSCPLYGKEVPPEESGIGGGDQPAADDPVDVVKTVGELCKKTDQAPPVDDARVCKIDGDGIRLKISKTLCKHAEKMKRNALRLHIPKHVISRPNLISPKSKLRTPREIKRKKQSLIQDTPSTSTKDDIQQGETPLSSSGLSAVSPTPAVPVIPPPPPTSSAAPAAGGSLLPALVRHRKGTLDESDYLSGPQKSVHRRRADPRVSMATIFHDIFNEIKAIEGAEDLMYPVNAKKVPDYYEIVKKPMDLQQVRKNIAENRYDLRRQLIEDLMQILNNSRAYNGATHEITQAAQKIFDLATRKMQENELKLIQLEKTINPLLDDDDMVGFAHILTGIVHECKNLPKSAAFHSKVDAKKFPNYSQMVSRPMDLGTIEQNVKDHKYTTISAFKIDIEQIHTNSELFNGKISPYTQKAMEIIDLANRQIQHSYVHLVQLEANIQKTLVENAVAADLVDDSASVVSGYSTATEQTAGPSALLRAAVDIDKSADSQEELDAAAPNKIFYIEEEEEAPEESVAAADDMARRDSVQQFVSPVDDDVGTAGEGSSAYWNTTGVCLFQSQMFASGQLNSDLALSESDEEEELRSAKRQKLDDDEDDFDSSLCDGE